MMLVCKHDKGYVSDLVVLAKLDRYADLYDNPAFIIYIPCNYVINMFLWGYEFGNIDIRFHYSLCSLPLTIEGLRMLAEFIGLCTM